VLRYKGIPPYPETRRFVARVLRRMGDRQTADRVMVKPVPAPQWLSRIPRPLPKVQMVSAPATRPLVGQPEPYPSMVPLSAPRPDRGPQVLLQDADGRPSPRGLAPTAAVPDADAAPAPEPTAPIAQSP
jgi:hypothetical protein